MLSNVTANLMAVQMARESNAIIQQWNIDWRRAVRNNIKKRGISNENPQYTYLINNTIN